MLVLGTALNIQAQNPGELDTDFGIEGYVIHEAIPNTSELYNDMITRSNDKIVMVGYSFVDNQNIIIAQFNPDGSADITFGNNGILEIDASIGGNDQAWAVKELNDGKLLITGITVTAKSWDAFVMRIEEDGTIDETFGTTVPGRTNLNAGDLTISMGTTIEVLTDNSILVGAVASFDGQLDMCVFKLTQGGGLDESFASGGVGQLELLNSDEELNAMALTANGLIILAGSSTSDGEQSGIIAQLSAFGTPTSFAEAGYFSFNLGENNAIYDVMVDSNDNIVGAGSSGDDVGADGLVVRLLPDGSLDESFAGDGYQMSDPGASTTLKLMNVFETENGGVLTCGYSSGLIKESYAFLMLANGSPDAGFGGNGDASADFAISINSINGNCGALQSDGGILIGGEIVSQDFVGNTLYMIRLHPTDGMIQGVENLEGNQWLVYPNPVQTSFRIESKEQVLGVELYNMKGQLCGSWLQQNNYDIPSHLANGSYVIRLLCKGAYKSDSIILYR